MKQKIYKVSKERAIQIAADYNCVSIEIARNYTDSELKEVLRMQIGRASCRERVYVLV